MEEGLLGGQRTVADLSSRLAPALADLPLAARVTEARDSGDKGSQPVWGDEVGKGFFQNTAQDGGRVVAGPEVTQRVEGVVGPLGACGAKAKAQIAVGVDIHQTTLDGDGADDGETELRGSGVGD